MLTKEGSRQQCYLSLHNDKGTASHLFEVHFPGGTQVLSERLDSGMQSSITKQ